MCVSPIIFAQTQNYLIFSTTQGYSLKQAAAILLLILFLFNWFGYRLLSGYLQQQADTKLEAQLDQNQYDASRLIEMRVPLNIPYQINSSDWERYDGNIEINGTHYKYVKRKVENGQLVLLCLPNETRMRLQSARDEFFKLVNDLQQANQSKSAGHGHSVKNPVTEYWQVINNWNLEAVVIQPDQFTCCNVILPSHPSVTAPAQPPDC